jgi:undecaprenyl-diphosphatase
MEANELSGDKADSNSSMTYTDALVYGIVEGVTEFLPISSTGHLVIASEVLTRGDAQSDEALFAYLIVIQAGAILAVFLLYRKEVWSMMLGLLGLDPRGKRLAINVIVAFLPAAILGPILDDKIEEFLFGLLPIAIALLLGALLMYWVEKRKKAKDSGMIMEQGRTLDDLTLAHSLTIGFLQCFAMWPGTSRSMMTIVGGYLVGLQRKKAAEFSFLLGLVTLSAAAGYKVLTKWDVMEANLSLGPILFGCLIAGISAALSVFWLVGYLSRRGLGVFVWYRIVLSIVLFIIYFNSQS